MPTPDYAPTRDELQKLAARLRRQQDNAGAIYRDGWAERSVPDFVTTLHNLASTTAEQLATLSGEERTAIILLARFGLGGLVLERIERELEQVEA